MSSLNPRQMFLLDEACKPLAEAFGQSVYLVGSAVENPDFHDVDVRLMLDDCVYDSLVEAIGMKAIFFMSIAVGQYLSSRTGLPIDFQFQRSEQANAKHAGRRNPLGIRDLSDYCGDAHGEMK